MASEPILSELRETLTDKSGIPTAEVAAIVDQLDTYIERDTVAGNRAFPRSLNTIDRCA